MGIETFFGRALISSEYDSGVIGRRPLEILLNDSSMPISIVPFGTGSFIKNSDFEKKHPTFHYPSEAVVIGSDSNLIRNISFAIHEDRFSSVQLYGSIGIENVFRADEIRFSAKMGHIIPDDLNTRILIKRAEPCLGGTNSDKKIAFPMNFSIGGEDENPLIPVIMYGKDIIYLFSIDSSLLPNVKERIKADSLPVEVDEMPLAPQGGDYDREFLKRKAEPNTSEIKLDTKSVNQSVRSMPRPYTPFRELSPSEIREEQLKKRLANLRKELNDIYKGGNRGSGTKDNASFLRKEISKIEGQVVRSKRRPY